jgi:cytosine/adenosine deaminase-related metal-dependent hydrolase
MSSKPPDGGSLLGQAPRSRSGGRWRAAWVVPVATAPIRDGAVAVVDGAIVACGPAAAVAAAHADLPERDLGAALLLPGLVDAHCHLEWSLMSGLAAAGRFPDWLGALLDLRGRMGAGDHAAAAALGALRCLEAGTTTVADAGPTGAGVAALTAAGLRGQVHLETFGDPRGTAATEAAARLAERVAALEGDAGPLVAVGISPHAPYTVGPDLWRALAEHPDLGRRRWSSHLAESAEESAAVAGGGALAELLRGLGFPPPSWPGEGGPVSRLAGAGALRPGMVVAHCVQLEPGDAGRLARAGVGVAHCPQSNAALRCGRAPIEELAAAGVPVGLGTDSPASAGPFDLRAEARACALVHGAARVAAPDAAALVRLMTLGGAAALGLERAVGSLEPGKRADLVALEPPPDAVPGDPCAAALHPGARVVEVVVDGRPVLERGRPSGIDRERTLTRAGEARRRVC